MYKRGAVIGKFYPFHLGHKYLIDNAAANCEKLYIMVCGNKNEKIDMKIRYQWVRDTYPLAEVILVEDEDFDQDDSKLWSNLTIRWLGFKPDVVFTSEKYGDTWAKYLKSDHYKVDIDRGTYSVSGTKVRNNPYKYWQYLLPQVRAYYVKKICIVGAESTGKSTLSQDLAKYYKTVWVPEYGRAHWEARLTAGENFEWREKDFVKIAKEQNRLEDELVLEANKLMICDTDSFATGIWFERYMGYVSPTVNQISDGREYDLYIIPDVNTPFEDDGTRDGEHLREWMYERFISELEKRGKKYIMVSGDRDERLRESTKIIDKLFEG